MIIRKKGLQRRAWVNKKTRAQSEKEKSMHDMYDHKAVEDEAFCTGCGQLHSLTHSHIISRKEKELMDDPRNVTYHCSTIYGSNGCSNRWENTGERAFLNDYKSNMQYIQEVRPRLFADMIVKDYSFFKKNQDKVCLTKFFDYICTEFENL